MIFSKDRLVALGSTLLGGVVGILAGGPYGGLFGAVFGWLLQSVAVALTENYRLKEKILKTLRSDRATQLRDVMSANKLPVPVDCFRYDECLPFVKDLSKYRKAVRELELEHRVIFSDSSSAKIGYVDPPHDWVNEWAGRAYLKNRE